MDQEIEEIFGEFLVSSGERRAKNVKRRKEVLEQSKTNTLEIEKCQSIAPENDTYFES